MNDSGDRPFSLNDSASDAAKSAGRQIRLQVDEREMSTSYANAFRTNATGDEVFIDFGLNMIIPAPAQRPDDGQAAAQGQMMLKFNDRVILNYRTAKRLAITLGQVIRRHEERFGEIPLDAPGGDGVGH